MAFVDEDGLHNGVQMEHVVSSRWGAARHSNTVIIIIAGAAARSKLPTALFLCRSCLLVRRCPLHSCLFPPRYPASRTLAGRLSASTKRQSPPHAAEALPAARLGAFSYKVPCSHYFNIVTRASPRLVSYSIPASPGARLSSATPARLVPSDRHAPQIRRDSPAPNAAAYATECQVKGGPRRRTGHRRGARLLSRRAMVTI